MKKTIYVHHTLYSIHTYKMVLSTNFTFSNAKKIFLLKWIILPKPLSFLSISTVALSAADCNCSSLLLLVLLRLLKLPVMESLWAPMTRGTGGSVSIASSWSSSISSRSQSVSPRSLQAILYRIRQKGIDLNHDF